MQKHEVTLAGSTKQHLYVVSALPLTHRTRVSYLYPTRSINDEEFRIWAGTVWTRYRSACTVPTIKYHNILFYSDCNVWAEYRNLNQDQFKETVKRRAASYIT